jgi:hypothetical protein
MHYIFLIGWLVALLIFRRQSLTKDRSVSHSSILALATMFGFWLITAPLQILGAASDNDSYSFAISTYYYTLTASGIAAYVISRGNYVVLIPYLIFAPALIQIVVGELLFRHLI